MGVVKAYRKTHWVVALDTDLASIPNPQLGDTALTEDKKKLYYWEGGAWKTGLGYEFVPRFVTAIDFTEASFTRDDNWYVDGLDLSGIIPAGAVAACLRVSIFANAAGKLFELRTNATTKEKNLVRINTQVASQWLHLAPCNISLDSDRLLDYHSSVNMTNIWVTVLGWYI